MNNRKRNERLKLLGMRDAMDGKSIDAFQQTRFKRHTESMRAAYEIGWRAGKKELTAK